MLNTIPTHPDAESYVSIAEADAYFEERIDIGDWETKSEKEKAAILRRATREIESQGPFICTPYFQYPMYYRQKQKLSFPLRDAKSWTFFGSSFGTDFVITNLFLDRQDFFDDALKDWALIVISGRGRGQTKKVTSYSNETGKVTVDSEFTTVPDSTSQFLVIDRIPWEIKYAVFEQALHIVKKAPINDVPSNLKRRKIDDLEEEYFSPADGADGGVSISEAAETYLDAFISTVSYLGP